jgi:alginate O-acetyltransferase complex protein AlgI
MGFELRVNFAQPYFSRSLSEFWHRWHISLSTWFRDYIYIPLGGNRVAVPRHYLNLFVTFLISGLWHGANWTFLLWGGLHGAFLIASHATSGLRARLGRALLLDRSPALLATLQRSSTLAFVCFAWIIFRAKDVGSAWYILTHLVPFSHFNMATLSVGGLAPIDTPFLAFFVVIMFAVEWWTMHPHRAPRIWRSSAFRWCGFYACAYSVIFFGVFGHIDFIYFQF